MAEKPKNKPTKKTKKLLEDLESISSMDYARERYRESRGAGETRTSALKASVKRYGEAGEAKRTLITGRKGGAEEFFKYAGFENLGMIAGALFDRKATEEDTKAARQTLGLKEEEQKKEKKEKDTSVGDRESIDSRKVDYIVRSTQEIKSRLESIYGAIAEVDKNISYVVDRVAPKLLEAKKERGEGIKLLQFDPLAPAGEQFRQVSASGKATVAKAPKEYMRSATMKAALMGKMPSKKEETTKVERFKDPAEKSFTEEFKKEDPIALLREDMNENFKKVFESLKTIEEQTLSCGSGGAADLLGAAGDLIGRRNRRARTGPRGRPSPRGRAPRPTRGPMPRAPLPAPSPTRTPTPSKPTGAVGRKWKLFLNFVKRKSPKLFAKVGARLAAAGAGLAIPGPGWIATAITILGSAWLAYDLYDLWTEFNDLPDDQQDSFEKDTETAPEQKKRGAPIPAQYEQPYDSKNPMPGAKSSSGTAAPAASSTPIMSVEQMLTPTGSIAESAPNSGPPLMMKSAANGPGGIPNIAPTPPKKISNQQGKSSMIKALDKKGVADPKARAAIMAQVAHESGGFTQLSENLKYSPPRLKQVFSYYKRNPEEAAIDAGNPGAVASKAYGNRLGNGPPPTGDGWEYRGRGFIQLTGKSNYSRFGVNNPDDLLNPDKAAENAVDYMLGYNGDWSDVAGVTRYVNGNAMLGLGERAGYFDSFLNDPEVTQADGVVAPVGGDTSVASAAPAGGGGGGGAAAPVGDTGNQEIQSALGSLTSMAGAAEAVAGETALQQSGVVSGAPGGPVIPAATGEGITKSQTNALLDIAAQNRAKANGISVEQARSELNVGTPTQRGEGVTKSQTNALLDIAAQNRAKASGISVEQARSELSFTPQATVQPIQTVSGQGMDLGSQVMEMGKSALAAAQISPTLIMPPSQAAPAAQPQQQKMNPLAVLGEVATRAAESAFQRAISKDFSHPTAFTTIGTI